MLGQRLVLADFMLADVVLTMQGVDGLATGSAVV
jgi:hypothetical protein